jgi:hypothetical protein
VIPLSFDPAARINSAVKGVRGRSWSSYGTEKQRNAHVRPKFFLRGPRDAGESPSAAKLGGAPYSDVERLCRRIELREPVLVASAGTLEAA